VDRCVKGDVHGVVESIRRGDESAGDSSLDSNQRCRSAADGG
jgi:hypothetical protein